MQMIPPSDSVGRTADIFPSKWHSPAHCFTQSWPLSTSLGSDLPNLIANVLTLNKATANSICLCENEKMEPLKTDNKEYTTTISTYTSSPPRKIKKKLFLPQWLAKEKCHNIMGHTAWRVENSCLLAPTYFLNEPLCTAQLIKPYMVGLTWSLKDLCTSEFPPLCGIKKLFFNSGYRDPLYGTMCD